MYGVNETRENISVFGSNLFIYFLIFLLFPNIEVSSVIGFAQLHL